MPGRNDPCPCGSGQKFKKCCLERSTTTVPSVAPICPDCVNTAHFELDSLSESELFSLNRRIVARIRFLQQGKVNNAMFNFKLGERVLFNTGERVVSGVLTRFNRKTVTIISNEGEHWNVSPQTIRSQSNFHALETKRDLTLLS